MYHYRSTSESVNSLEKVKSTEIIIGITKWSEGVMEQIEMVLSILGNCDVVSNQHIYTWREMKIGYFCCRER